MKIGARASKVATTVSALLALAACTGVRERNVPEDVRASIPGEFKQPSASRDLPVADAAAGTAAQGVSDVPIEWWRSFGDPALEKLVEHGLAHNSDLAIGAARLLEAQALARQAGADRFPEVGLFATGTRQRAVVFAFPGAPSGVTEGGSYGADIAYEVDLWGRLHAETVAARQRYLAEGYTLASLRLVIAAELVRGYVQVQTLEAQRSILTDNVSVLADSLRLSERRFAQGSIAEFDVSRSRAELEDLRAQLAEITSEAAAARRALLVLAGNFPTEEAIAALPVKNIAGETKKTDGKTEAGAQGTKAGVESLRLPEIPTGLPSDLLTRRPDLRQAEAELAASRADLSAARRALFPSLQITGSAGKASDNLSQLFDAGTSVWAITADLAVTIFDAGRRRAVIQAANARRMQSLESYRDAVREAFREVLDALDARAAAAAAYEARSQQTQALERSLHLAQRRYDEGYSAYLEVLDARRSLLQARLAAVSARSATALAYADLVLAVGGGWDPTSVPR